MTAPRLISPEEILDAATKKLEDLHATYPNVAAVFMGFVGDIVEELFEKENGK